MASFGANPRSSVHGETGSVAAASAVASSSILVPSARHRSAHPTRRRDLSWRTPSDPSGRRKTGYHGPMDGGSHWEARLEAGGELDASGHGLVSLGVRHAPFSAEILT